MDYQTAVAILDWY